MTTSSEHSLKKRGLKDFVALRAFRANLKKHPWTRTWDRVFDGFSKKIYERLYEGDERFMRWEPEIQDVVGLYDQVTRGDIPEDIMLTEDPSEGVETWTDKVLAGFNSVDFVEECRRYAHTQQRGKDRNQAVKEFKTKVKKLFLEGGEPLPPPTPPGSLHSSEISDDTDEDTAEELGLGAGGSLKSGNVAEGISAAATMEVISDGSSVTVSSASGAVEAHSKKGGLAAWHPKNVLSEEWWTPQRGLIVAGAAGIGASLITGGLFLVHKLLRSKQNGKEQRDRRAHARSWDRVDTNDGEIPARLHL